MSCGSLLSYCFFSSFLKRMQRYYNSLKPPNFGESFFRCHDDFMTYGTSCDGIAAFRSGLNVVLKLVKVAGSKQIDLYLSEQAITAFQVGRPDDDMCHIAVGEGVHILNEHAFLREVLEHFRQ